MGVDIRPLDSIDRSKRKLDADRGRMKNTSVFSLPEASRETAQLESKKMCLSKFTITFVNFGEFISAPGCQSHYSNTSLCVSLGTRLLHCY